MPLRLLQQYGSINEIIDPRERIRERINKSINQFSLHGYRP
jgi:hypothetical protein